jgi:hypothetical protein
VPIGQPLPKQNVGIAWITPKIKDEEIRRRAVTFAYQQMGVTSIKILERRTIQPPELSGDCPLRAFWRSGVIGGEDDFGGNWSSFSDLRMRNAIEAIKRQSPVGARCAMRMRRSLFPSVGFSFSTETTSSAVFVSG